MILSRQQSRKLIYRLTVLKEFDLELSEECGENEFAEFFY